MALIEAIITDIEGTTSSLAVLKELLAPYARRQLRPYVEAQRERADVQAALRAARELAGEPGADEARTLSILERWIDEDKKAPPLKALQGLVWERGYRDGSLRAHLYPDVVPALRAFKHGGLRLYVYSSGSRFAQQLFFEHSVEGDVRALFDGYFDTEVGAKGEPDAYRRIARELGAPPGALLFLSDAQVELDAAREAGLRVLGLQRPGNPPLRGRTIQRFDQIELGAFAPDPRADGVAGEIAALGRFCHARGWALATGGNFSARLAGGLVAITASGRDKAALSAADVVLVDLQGQPLDPEVRPSAETALHCALYRARPEVGAVAHTHSVAATVLSRQRLERGALRLRGYEMLKALPGVLSHERELAIPIVPNSQDMPALARALDDALRACPDAPAYLVAGHGLTTWAADLGAVRRHLEALEFLFACTLAGDRLA